MLETFLHMINCSLTLQTLIYKKIGKEIVMFEKPILSRNPYNFLKGKKYIVPYENLAVDISDEMENRLLQGNTACNSILDVLLGSIHEDIVVNVKCLLPHHVKMMNGAA